MFRNHYLDHETLMEQLRDWATAHPEICRLSSIGTTDQGRDIPLLTIGRDPDRIRPAVWVDANMHASELAGSSVVLSIAEDLLALHDGRDTPALSDLAAPQKETLRDVLFYLCPRMSPDGAELVLTTHQWVRSSPTWRSPRRLHPRWVHEDVDGDGKSLVMRQEDPAGDWVPMVAHPHVLRPRRLEDAPPYYKLYPEGTVTNFDGRHVPDPYFLSDNDIDLNRNFPNDWRPEPHQAGAGPFAASEPESRAVVAFAATHPNIFAWLNLHCFGGVNIRPLGDAPDSKMNPEELPLWRQLEVWAKDFTGYPTVSGFEEFTYEPENPLRGDLTAWAHKARGAFAWVVELWDIFARLDMARPKRFVDFYDRVGEPELTRLVEFDRDHNAGRMFPGWRPFNHPQLGPVEVGGFAPLIGLWNPPEAFLPDVCLGQSKTLLRVASMSPRLSLKVTAQAMGEAVGETEGQRLTRVTVEVINTGYLPTWFLPSAKTNPVSEPLWLSFSGDPQPLDGKPRVEVGHLAGWGQGHLSPGQSIIMPRSGGTADRWKQAFVVAGAGELTVRIESSRAGHLSQTVRVG